VGKLPFKPASLGQLASGQGTAKTLQVPVMRGLGDTVPVGDKSIRKAVAVPPLCAELSVLPQRSAEILLRYQVLSTAAHGALDEHWQEHFAGDPEAHAAFERASHSTRPGCACSGGSAG
jgi:hypothetical protein